MHAQPYRSEYPRQAAFVYHDPEVSEQELRERIISWCMEQGQIPGKWKSEEYLSFVEMYHPISRKRERYQRWARMVTWWNVPYTTPVPAWSFGPELFRWIEVPKLVTGYIHDNL